MVLVFLGALLDAPGNTARMAIIPELADAGGVSLERANGASQAIQSASMFLGPPLAGVCIALMGSRDVLWLDAASFFISAAIFLLLVPSTLVEGVQEGRYLDQVWEGLSFIRGIDS